ncbi:hypothetical protein DFH60_002029 [Clostridium beijerinckii]|nr:hypothetical protein [Clostridium beijerinckii]
MSKQVDFIREEEKLSEILEILNKEILKYLEKRKNVTNYILEARKNTLRNIKMMKTRL